MQAADAAPTAVCGIACCSAASVLATIMELIFSIMMSGSLHTVSAGVEKGQINPG